MDRGGRRSRMHEAGAVLVMTALLLPVILGFAALALDLGYLLVVKNELQRACDAAALAGAQELQTSADKAQDRAREYFRQNTILGRTMDPTRIMLGTWDPNRQPKFIETRNGPTAIQVEAASNESLFFARSFPQLRANVAANAVGVAGGGSGDRNIMLVLDRTGSMNFRLPSGQTRIDGLQEAVAIFLKQLETANGRTAIGMVSFSAHDLDKDDNYGDLFIQESNRDSKVVQDINAVRTEVRRMSVQGGTCTYCGLAEAFMAHRPGWDAPGWLDEGSVIYVVISDGEANRLPQDLNKWPRGIAGCPVDPVRAKFCSTNKLPPPRQAPPGTLYQFGCPVNFVDKQTICVADQMKGPEDKPKSTVFMIHYGDEAGQALMKVMASPACPDKFPGDPDKQCFWDAPTAEDLKQILKKVAGWGPAGLVK